MNELVTNAGIKPSDTHSRLSIWLVQAPEVTGRFAWTLESVSLNSESFNQVLNFRGKVVPSTHLHSTLWSYISSVMSELDGKSFYVRQDLALNLPGVTLRGVQFVAEKFSQGRRKILVTFSRILGTLAGVFRPGRCPDALADNQSQLATWFLDDVMRPSLDLCALTLDQVDPDSQEPIRNRLRALREKRDEIEFMAALLTRYVTQHADYSGSGAAKLDPALSDEVQP